MPGVVGPARTLAVALITAGCGAQASPSVAPSERDDAVELAALLPERVERCIVARPALLSARQRALVETHSWAEPLAWDRELPVVAYAAAYVDASDGGQARRTYLRFSERSPGIEAIVRDAGVRMSDEPCGVVACRRRPVARWIDARTLEIARYEWAPPAPPSIPSANCSALARGYPGAIEVAADTSVAPIDFVPGLVSAEHELTARVSRVLFARGRSLVSRREMVFTDPVLARIFELRVRMRSSIETALVPLPPGEQIIERDGARVAVTEAHSWEELELALEDERLRRLALVVQRRSRRPVELEQLRIEDTEVVRREVALRRAQLSHTGPAERAAAAGELAELLGRAMEAHPAELAFAYELAGLALAELDQPERAVAIAEDVLSRGLADEPERWRTLHREAIARSPRRDLSSALAADGIASAADAPRAAVDLRALVEAGVPYEWAEGAWRTSRELFAGPAPRRDVDARLAFEGALAAIVVWARLHGAGDHPTVQIAVRTSASSEARAIGESRPELIAVRAPNGGTVYIGALASPDIAELRRLGAMLAAAAPSGPIEIAIALRGAGGGSGPILRASGVRAGDTLVLERAGVELERVPWPSLARYVAAPLAELPTALFPAPTLTVRCESAEIAAELWRGTEATHPGACSTAGPVLRCESARGVSELVMRIAELRLR